jgi:galacturan 1,4-alpha-galacturonidase
MPVGYQNQSTAWIIGGDQVTVDGHGYGTLNGNGDVWYSEFNGKSNYPGRPHAMTVANTTDSNFQGLRFIRSQMWYVRDGYLNYSLLNLRIRTVILEMNRTND